MANKNNSLSLMEQANKNTSIMTDALTNAINVHAGATAIEVKQDSDGKDYLSATFKLKAPTSKMSEIVVNDKALMESLERIRKADSLGEVSVFLLSRELANIADTDASKCGFDNSESLVGAVLGKAKSTLANYKRIGQYFVNADYTLRGAIPQETSISLLNQLLSFVPTETETGEADIRNVECLFKYGILTPYMRQKDYKRIINALKAVEVSKELHEMTEQEVQDFKKALEAIMNAKPEKKEKEVTTESERGEADGQEQASNDPQVIIGQSMNIITTLQDNFKKLTLTEEQEQLVATWLDNLYITLGDMLN